MVTTQIDTTVRIAGKTWTNPVGVASGTFGFGEEYASLCDLEQLGAIFTKAVTPEKRDGNTPPRLANVDGGMLNAIGLANPGLESFLQLKMPKIESLPCPAIINVAGASVDDYIKVAETLNHHEAIWGIEVNVSCPNVDHGGMAFGTNPKVLGSLVKQLRKAYDGPLIVKLSPNVTDITETARAAEAEGADALSCINTVTGMKIDVNTRRPLISRGTAGFSGSAIRPIGVAAVWRVSKAVSIPIIGLGGIGCTNDALEYLLAGASAIQVGTALFSNPKIPNDITKGIEEYMQENGFQSLSDFHGHF
ncbi:MAG: dihydroorotate dehydrogenase [Spirochaetales bacterium]|nr:dihydroorotate dehydrogenase [Spirochaetales bacterium]